MNQDWNWPGSKWWKCDFHLHTPGSKDYRESVTSDDWVAAAIAKGLDAVAITDHHTGEYVQKIQDAIKKSGNNLVVFPAVELTVSNGVHLLVLFDPEKNGDAVTAFLGKCDLSDESIGKVEACAQCSLTDAMKKAVERNALCIGAHVDDVKGFLKEIKPGKTLQDIVTSNDLHAIEVKLDDPDLLKYVDNSMKDYKRPLGVLPMLTFSDAHNLQDIGKRFTWIKMTYRNLEGLRLALQDGFLSVLPFNKAVKNPNTHADLVIESIEISNAKYIGRISPLNVRFNPWLNAIIGGRGTGKSSILEFLRIALRRENESSQKYAKVSVRRDDDGLLKENAEFRIIYRKDGQRFRIQWDSMKVLTPIEEELEDGTWQKTDGLVPHRFPAHIYSQNQIYMLAEHPQALLKVIDDASEIKFSEWNEEWKEEENHYLSLQAKKRELSAKLADELRIKSKLEDVKHKLSVFENSGHKDILKAYQRYQGQQRAIQVWQESFENAGKSLKSIAEKILPIDFDMQLFDNEHESDKEILQTVKRLNDDFIKLQKCLEKLANFSDKKSDKWKESLRNSLWHKQLTQASQSYDALVEKLQKEGIGDLNEYGQKIQEKHVLEQHLENLNAIRREIETIQKQADESLTKLQELRRELTARRSDFLEKIVGNNPYVRIQVIPYCDKLNVESQFRALIGKEREFQDSIWSENGKSGIIANLYQDGKESFEDRLNYLKKNIRAKASDIPADDDFNISGYFTNHLQSIQKSKSEILDRIDCWFPEDSLQVSYSSNQDGSKFRPVEQGGSAGQKTAAILAFLLSYGNEPMILDQPEDDLDNQLIYDLIVCQLHENKKRRQIIVVTHNPNIVVNGDAELVIVLDVVNGQTQIVQQGGLQEKDVREKICKIMEGGEDAFKRRYLRITQGVSHA